MIAPTEIAQGPYTMWERIYDRDLHSEKIVIYILKAATATHLPGGIPHSPAVPRLIQLLTEDFDPVGGNSANHAGQTKRRPDETETRRAQLLSLEGLFLPERQRVPQTTHAATPFASDNPNTSKWPNYVRNAGTDLNPKTHVRP